jgi:hypothetical protein
MWNAGEVRDYLRGYVATDLVVGVGKATRHGTGCELVEMAKEASGASKTLTL